MAEITAKMIKELRELTGMGMSDCKKALVDAEGNVEEAEMILRKKGLDKAAKKADRATGQGVVSVREKDGVVICLQIECEQEPTTKNERFLALIDKVFDAAFASKAATIEELVAAPTAEGTVADSVTAVIGVIGENVVIKNIACFAIPENGTYGAYSHFNGKSGAICVVEIEGGAADEEFKIAANDVCMHAVATRPVALNRTGVPEDLVRKEKEVFLEEIKNKPENIQEKILEGKLAKFYGEKCLEEQIFVKDPEGKLTVGAMIDAAAKKIGGKAKIVDFARLELGN